MSIKVQRKKPFMGLGAFMGVVALVLVAVYVYGHSGESPREMPRQIPQASQLLSVVVPDDVPQQMVKYEGMNVNFNKVCICQIMWHGNSQSMRLMATIHVTTNLCAMLMWRDALTLGITIIRDTTVATWLRPVT